MTVLVPVAARAETITLTGGEKFIESSYGKWLERIYREAFHRLGYEFKLVGYPSQRAIIMADNGEVDGQIERGYDFATQHPNLIRVEESTNTEAYSAFAKKPGIKLNGWGSLKGTTYTIAARRGVGKTIESLTELIQPRDRIFYIERPEQGLRMLALGRTDVYIEYEPVAKETLNTLMENEQSVFSGIYKAGELDYTSHHAFLHKKHAKLAPRLAKVLQKMKQEGLFEKYRTGL
jgi:ABC-type amino acid transport substrate-binding protein